MRQKEKWGIPTVVMLSPGIWLWENQIFEKIKQIPFFLNSLDAAFLDMVIRLGSVGIELFSNRPVYQKPILRFQIQTRFVYTSGFLFGNPIKSFEKLVDPNPNSTFKW